MAMTKFIDLTLSGISNGAIYAAVALALVLIWRATRIVNFAQGAMLMITTFIASARDQRGGSYCARVRGRAAVRASCSGGRRAVLIRPVESAPPLNAVIVTLGLYIVAGGGRGDDLGQHAAFVPGRVFDPRLQVGGTTLLFTPNDTFIVLIVIAVGASALALLFRATNLGLQMRAAAFAPEVARLLGVRVGRMFTLGWALAAVAGSLAGVLVAPSVFLAPDNFDPILIGGFVGRGARRARQPAGRVVGGLDASGWRCHTCRATRGRRWCRSAALVILVLVLMVRPGGLFSATRERRV